MARKKFDDSYKEWFDRIERVWGNKPITNKSMCESQSVDGGYTNIKHDDFIIDDRTFGSKINNISQTFDTKEVVHSYMKFGQSNNNYALVRSTTTYNFHVIPEIDIVSVTKINIRINSNGMDILSYDEESHTMTVEDARKFYIELTEKSYEEV